MEQFYREVNRKKLIFLHFYFRQPGIFKASWGRRFIQTEQTIITVSRNQHRFQTFET